MSNEWKMVKIGDVCNILNGYAFKSTNYTKDGIRVMRIANVQKGKVTDDDPQFYPMSYADTINNYMLYEGDLLMSLTGNVGRVGILTKALLPAALNQRVACLRLKKCDQTNLRYLYNFLNSDSFENDCIVNSQGIAQKNMSTEWLKRYSLPLPSIERQREIAAVLDKANELVEKRKAQLAELDRLAESVFYDMFGDPVTNPKSWGVSTLKNLTTKIGSGATPKGGNENYKSDGISLIRSLNVHNSKFKYKDLAFIDELQAKALDGVTVEQDDVLLNITGASVARCCIVPNDILPARVNQHVAILRVKKDKLNFKFLCNVLISSEYQNKLLKDSKSNGATREALTKSNLEDLIIIIPPLGLQCQFATIIEKIEEQKAKVKEALKESEDLFQRLMQDMFNPEYHKS